MPKPTNEFSLVLRRLPLSTKDKTHLYLLHIATKKPDGTWFAMVKSRTIAEALDIDSNQEVVRALQDIGAVESTTNFMNRTVPGYVLGRSERSDRASGTEEPGNAGEKELWNGGMKEDEPTRQVDSDLATRVRAGHPTDTAEDQMEELLQRLREKVEMRGPIPLGSVRLELWSPDYEPNRAVIEDVVREGQHRNFWRVVECRLPPPEGLCEALVRPVC